MGRNVRRVVLLLSLVATCAVARGNEVASQAGVDEPVDFIRFAGAVYLSTAYLAEDSPSVASANIGAGEVGPVVGQVISDWVDPENLAADPYEPCSWQSADGTAPRLSPGDDIYAVRGYATTFRVAARQGEGFIAYQIWCSDRARVGADLFDIYHRVDRISVTGDTSETSGWAVIDDSGTVSGLVAMLLEGPVIPAENVSTAPVTHQLIFHLDDGTSFRASAAVGELLWGLGAVGVPAAFTETLDRAWERQLSDET